MATKQTTKEKRYGIRLRLICDMRNSGFPYQSQSTRKMLQKLPIEADILPEYLPYIMDAIFLASRMFQHSLESKDVDTYEDLYKEFDFYDSRKKDSSK